MNLSGITKDKISKNNLDHFMVIPHGAPEVADLVDRRLEPVVHCLWLLSFVEDESTKFSLDRFTLGDFGHLIPFMRHFEDVPNFFGTLQPLHLVVFLSTQGSEKYRGGLVIEVPYLGSFIRIIILVPRLWCMRSKLNNIPYILSWSEVRWCLILSLHIQ
jgi:hypothetical protein